MRAAGPMNPLVPAAYDVVWTVVLVGVVALAVTAAGQVLRARSLSGGDELAWLLAVVLLPVAGPLLWFLVGRQKHSSPLPRA